MSVRCWCRPVGLLTVAVLWAWLGSACSRFEPLPATSDSGAGFEVLDTTDAVIATDGQIADASDASVGSPSDSLDGGPAGDAPSGGDVPIGPADDGEVGSDVATSDADTATPDSATPDAVDHDNTDAEVAPGDTPTPDDTSADALDPDDTVDGGPTADACVDTCPEEDANRCADGDVPAIERCQIDPATGCLAWLPHADCGEPADPCAGSYECVEGACIIGQGTAVECDETNPDPCITTACNPATGECEETIIGELGGCDDGDPCTVLEKCDADGLCTNGLPDAVSCPCDGDDDCFEFDDGDACNGRYVCGPFSACVLAPEPIVCPESEAECLDLVCATNTGECVPVPVNEGLDCDDGDACSTQSTCVGGVCAGAEYTVCEPGLCESSACDTETGECVTELLDACCGNGIPEGVEQCDDGDPAAPECDDVCDLAVCAPVAVTFDDACMLIGGGGLLGTFGDVTIELFVRPAAVSQESVLFDREATTGPGDLDWSVGVTTDNNQPRLTWREGRLEQFDASIAGPVLAVEQWQHVAIVRSLSAPGGLVTFYVDGVPAGSQSVDVMHDLGGTQDLWLGCQDGFTANFAGDLDELAIHQGVKYGAGFVPPQLPLFVAETTELLMHFDHATAGVSVDATGAGHDGYWQGVVPSTSHPFEDSQFGAVASCDAAWCNRSALGFALVNEGVAATKVAPAGLDDVQTLTLEFFLRVDLVPSQGEEMWIVGTSQGGQGEADWHVVAHATPTGQIRLKWVEGQFPGQFDNFVSTVQPLTPGQVHHIAAVRYYESAGDAAIRWYIDGEGETLTLLSGALALEPPTALQVGSNGGTDSFLVGFLDDLRISEGALYDDDFPFPSELWPRWDTLGLYRFDAGFGSWSYPEPPSTLPPLLLEGVQWTPDGLTDAPDCP